MKLHPVGGVSQFNLNAAPYSAVRFADPSMWEVYVGVTEQPGHGAHPLAVEQIIYHARYRPKGLDYDIALMKLATSLVFNGRPPHSLWWWGRGEQTGSHASTQCECGRCLMACSSPGSVEPICLPNYGEEFEDGTTCWISGWGATEEDGEMNFSTFRSDCLCSHGSAHSHTWSVSRRDQFGPALSHGAAPLHQDLQPAGRLPGLHLLLDDLRRIPGGRDRLLSGTC